MACPQTSEIQLIIQSEQKTVRMYMTIYFVIAVIAVAAGIFLNFTKALEGPIGKIAELLVSSLLIPVAIMHVKRKTTLVAYQIMQERGEQGNPGDPACVELKIFIDQELSRRLGVAQ